MSSCPPAPPPIGSAIACGNEGWSRSPLRTSRPGGSDAGRPYGPDFGPDALPAEAGLEHTIDLTKGCFLGQESVAKVRNLGHPPWVLRLVRSTGSDRTGSHRPGGRRRGGRGHERPRRARRNGRDRPGPLGCGVRTALDRDRPAFPTAGIVDISGHFASATWGFASTSPTTPSPPWSLRAIPSVPDDGHPGGEER